MFSTKHQHESALGWKGLESLQGLGEGPWSRAQRRGGEQRARGGYRRRKRAVRKSQLLSWYIYHLGKRLYFSAFFFFSYEGSSVQFSRSVVSDSATPWNAALQASLSITNSWSLLKHTHWVSDAIQSSHPLSSPSPPTFNLSQHQSLFQWVNKTSDKLDVIDK